MEASPTIRPIEPTDLSRGFFEVLSQLTASPPLSADKFTALINQQRQLDLQQTVVVVREDRVIATGSIFIEPKFIRGGAPCAHIEDIVVDSRARGTNIGKKLIHYLSQFAKDRGCYKVILNCTDDNIGFYLKCGFRRKERQMALYFSASSEE